MKLKNLKMNHFIKKTPNNSFSKNIVETFLVNSRSLRKHHEELEVMIGNLESRPAIISITETLLGKTDLASCYKIKGYDIVSFKITQIREERSCFNLQNKLNL